MDSDKQNKVYKLKKSGQSYYICIPKPLVTDKMIEHGVYIHILDYSEKDLALRFVIADEHREHIENSAKSGKNTQELRVANGVC